MRSGSRFLRLPEETGNAAQAATSRSSLILPAGLVTFPSDGEELSFEVLAQHPPPSVWQPIANRAELQVGFAQFIRIFSRYQISEMSARHIQSIELSLCCDCPAAGSHLRDTGTLGWLNRAVTSAAGRCST